MFNVVGCGGFLVQIAAIAILTRMFGWSTLAATTVGLELAVLHNFIGHSCFVWPDAKADISAKSVARFGRYHVANAAGLAANLMITIGLVESGLPQELANVVAVVACALPNYFVADKLVFDPRL